MPLLLTALATLFPAFVDSGPRTHAHKRFYFTDHVLISRSEHAEFADVVTGPRIPDAKPLTPDNQFYFLYAMEEYSRLCEAPPAAGAVVLRRWCENF